MRSGRIKKKAKDGMTKKKISDDIIAIFVTSFCSMYIQKNMSIDVSGNAASNEDKNEYLLLSSDAAAIIIAVTKVLKIK